jgi:transcriptional regulator with XRE-family HTH domain
MNGKDKMALDAKDISGRIKLRMRERGISTEALAEKLGLSEPGVKKLLGGGSTVQYLKLRRLADVLDTTPNYLLHVEDDWSSSAKRSRAILEEATAAALQALGKLEPQTALALAKAILSIPDKPAIVSANLDEKTAARARAEIAVQEYLPPKN